MGQKHTIRVCEFNILLVETILTGMMSNLAMDKEIISQPFLSYTSLTNLGPGKNSHIFLYSLYDD